MRRTLATLSFALILGLLLVACAAPPTQPPATGGEPESDPTEIAVDAEAQVGEAEIEPTATPIVAEAGTGDIQLIYWNGLTGSDGATMVQMVEAFTEQNPDVSVRIEMMPWDIYFDKLLASLVSGNPPDLFLLHEFEIPQFASQGVLMPSGDFFTAQGGPIPTEDISPEILDIIEYQGEMYGVPLDRHGWGLWYNKDLFEAAGLDPESCPANAEELSPTPVS